MLVSEITSIYMILSFPWGHNNPKKKEKHENKGETEINGSNKQNILVYIIFLAHNVLGSYFFLLIKKKAISRFSSNFSLSNSNNDK